MRKNRNRSAVSVLKLNRFKITTLQMVMWLLVFMVGLSMLLIMNPTNIKLGIKGNNAVAIGTAENPDYTISDVEDLMAFAEKRQSTTSGQNFSSAWGISSNPKYILLTQDITLDVTTWTPIGGSSSSTRFYSIFDGGNHTITFSRPVTIDSQYAGLFGYAYGGSVIQNLGVNWAGGDGSTTFGLNATNTSTGSTYIGGIAGRSSSTITNCHTEGSISVNYTGTSSLYVGGVVGYGYDGIIDSSTNATIEVTSSGGSTDIGGIVGYSYETISNCHTEGSISVNYTGTSKLCVGGVVGYGGIISKCYSNANIYAVRNSTANYSPDVSGIGYANSVINCYNTGNISVENNRSADVAGIVSANSPSLVENCYNTGTIKVTNTSTGESISTYGIVDGSATVINCFNIAGSIDNAPTYGIGSGTLVNCYFDYATSTLSSYNGTQVENLSTLVKDLANFIVDNENIPWSKYALWDFDSTWEIVNGGYPTFKTESVEPTIELSGEGTEESPYLIEDEQDLIWLSTYSNYAGTYPYLSNAHFRLTKDLNLSATEFIPLFWANVYSFNGVFDGDNHTITFSSFTFYTLHQYLGLIGYGEDDSFIKNLGVTWTNATFDAEDDRIYAGGIIGGCSGTIENCHTSGDITIQSNRYVYAGGIVGENNTSVSINNCYNTANITAEASTYLYLGGIYGNGNGTISQCYNLGTLNTNSGGDIGGIVGYTLVGFISNCYNIGAINVQGNGDEISVGGIAGEGNEVYNSYNTADINVTNGGETYVGGIMGGTSSLARSIVNSFCVYESSTNGINITNSSGEIYVGNIAGSNSRISNCYYNYEYNVDSASSAYVTANTDEDTQVDNLSTLAKQEDNFVGWVDSSLRWATGYLWDFVNIWQIEGDNYPTFRTEPLIEEIVNPLNGEGTEDSPYLIEDIYDLEWLTIYSNRDSTYSNLSNAHYLLTTDIISDLPSYIPMFMNEDYSFLGNFNGGGHTITFNSPIENIAQYYGLFGYTGSNAVIKNVGVNWAGGDGINKYGISNTYTYIDVDGVYVGGIVGRASFSTQINSCFTLGSLYCGSTIGGSGSITGEAYAGGISGYYGRINNCYNRADIRAVSAWPNAYAGGITGYDGDIYNSYNTGKVTAEYTGTSSYNYPYAGGISGYGASIYNCFSAVGSEENAPTALGGSGRAYVGGILGYSGSVYNSYYDYVNTAGSTGSSVTTSTRGTQINESTTGQNLLALVKDPANFAQDNENLEWHSNYSWDFADTWLISPTYNDGLPVLRAFYSITITYQYDENDTSQNAVQDSSSLNETTLSGAIFTKDGYTYTQWTDGVNVYDINDTVLLTEDTVLYPVWVEMSQFSITFNGQGGSGIVYVIVDDQILSQAVLTNGLVLDISIVPTANFSIILSGNYYTQVTISPNGNITLQGNKIILNEYVDTVINYELSIGDFNNAIIV